MDRRSNAAPLCSQAARVKVGPAPSGWRFAASNAGQGPRERLAKVRDSPCGNAPAGRLPGLALGLLYGLLLLIPGVTRAEAPPPPERWAALSRSQPPEQPPGQPPEQPPEPPAQPPEGEEDVEEAPAADEEASATGEEVPAEASDEEGAGETEAGGEGAEGEDAEDEAEAPARRAPGIAAAPAGILPGRMLSAPAPVPGSVISAMVFGDDGFLVQTAGGAVIAYEPDAEKTRWGLPGAGAAFVGIAEDAETVALLDRHGEVTLRRVLDGVRVGGFATGLPPDGDLGGAGGGPVPAALAGTTLYWVSGGTLRGYRIPAGDPVLEVPLPAGEPSRVVVAAGAAESAADASSVLLVSLGSGGAVAVSPSGAIRWQVEGAGPVTGPGLVSADDRLAIVGDEGGDLTAVDLETGRQRWRWRLAEGFHHPPLLSRGRLYAATKANSLYCFDARRGGERWRAALPGRPAASPLRMAGAILVVTQDGLLVEVNGETGQRIGRPRDLESEVLGVVRRLGDGAREDGWRDRRLFLGLRDGRLAVFGPRTGASS